MIVSLRDGETLADYAYRVTEERDEARAALDRVDGGLDPPSLVIAALRDEIDRHVMERAELARQLRGLAAWQCQECGARFAETVAPAALHGVVRCSTCVERHEALDLVQRLTVERDEARRMHETDLRLREVTAERDAALALLRRVRPYLEEWSVSQCDRVDRGAAMEEQDRLLAEIDEVLK